MSASWRSRSHAQRRAARVLGVLVGVLAAAAVLAAIPGRAAAATSTYYVPKPEDQYRTVLLNMCPTAGTTQHTVISMVASADDSVITYDQWEDGYEADIAHPVQSTTEVWGDGNTANGTAPGHATDLLDSGNVIALENDVVTPRDPATIRYDGRDKIVANYMLAVTRAGWELNPGTVLAGAGEVHRTLDWGLDYRSPIGTNVTTADQHAMFTYTGMLIMASQGGTVVQIDAADDGTFETTTTLAEGESYLVNGGVRVGGHVVASKPVQVDVITGDTAATYESRSFSLYPTSLWSGYYYSPVGSTTASGRTQHTRVYVYNPSSTAFSVTMQRSGGTTTNTVPAGGYSRFDVPLNSGAYFYSAAGQAFFAVACASAGWGSGPTYDNTSTWDWGFSLIPRSSLTTQAIVGWGPGRDAASTVNPTENGSPVWVTPVADTTVYVDYDGDPTTGTLTDTYGNRCDLTYALTAWQSQKVFDTVDRNQTGMRLYTLDNTLIATAWGEDPATASTGAPGLDLGTTVLPLPEFTVSKSSALHTDVDGDGFIDPGDTITYSVRVNSVGPAPLWNISVVDPLPGNTTYVPNSTTYALYTGAPSPVADDASGTPYPLDEAGKSIAFVTPYQYFTYTFRVMIDAPLPPGVDTISNTVTAQMNVASMAQTNDTAVGGTPSVTRFAHEDDWLTVDSYKGDAMLYIETTDLDQDENPGVTETITVTVSSATGGDSEVVTLTETGPNTGVFRGMLLSSTSSGDGHDNGLLRAPVNDVLTATYNDPDFPTDTSSAVANIRPTLALVSSLTASAAPGAPVVVKWTTQAESGTLGFYLLRRDSGSGDYVKVNARLVPGLLDAPLGGVYRVVDRGARAGHRYTYLLRELEASGVSYDHGPYRTQVRAATQPVRMPASGATRTARAMSVADAARATTSRTTLRADVTRQAGRVGRRIKITSTEAGLVVVTARRLSRPMGISTAQVKELIRGGRVALSYRGAGVAYLPASSGCSLVFYDPGATGIYSNANVFWLQRGKGLLMKKANAITTSEGAATATFADTASVEKQVYYAPRLFSDPEADIWLWDYVYAGDAALMSKTFTVGAPGAAGTGAARLTLRMMGVAASEGSTHHVSVTVNGTVVGDGSWTGAAIHELTLDFDGALLADGDNQVRLAAEADAADSIVYLDAIKVGYQRRYIADRGSLLMRADDDSSVTVTGLTGAKVRVLDLSRPAAPVVVRAAVAGDARRGYRVTFEPATATTPYLVAQGSATHRPASVVADAASKLRTPSIGARYVIITTTSLRHSAQLLADYRAKQGLTAKVVALEDVYDEFNGGMPSPRAIESFLAYAYDNWRQPPGFVVLAGAGTIDHKDFRGYGGDLIPPLMATTPDGLVPSDQQLGDVTGDDGVPEIAVGRLPVVSAADLAAQVAKIKGYEAASGEWITRAIFAADDADSAGDFPAYSDALADLPASPYEAQKIYVDATDPTVARARLIAAWNRGAAFVSYLGHASLVGLTSNDLFDAADVASLDNGTRLPVVSLMTCTAGHFAVPGFDALAETLLLDPDGGAAAVWSPTGLSRNPDAAVLDEGFVRSLYVQGEHTLGTAMLASMRAYADLEHPRYVLYTYNLLGDPALAIR